MICIIPARGGSKRLPGKNLLKLDGEYIINRVIEIANNSELFTDVIVSTDSEEIADMVKGATLSMRPAQISGDIPEDKVLKWTAYKYGMSNICRIYPFAVLLTEERLRAGFKKYHENYDAVLECQGYTHPPLRCFDKEGDYEFPATAMLPTEKLLPYYHDAATYMFTHIGSLSKPLVERELKWIPVKEWEAQDVDNVDDWDMLQMKWNSRKLTNSL